MDSFSPVKAELIAALDRQRAEARAYAAGLPPSLVVHEDSGWTVRDLIVHLSAIEGDMIQALQNAITGESFEVDLRGQASPSDLYELRRRDAAGTSWSAILDDWMRIRDQLRGLVLAFPAEKMDLQFSNPFFQPYNLLGAVRACAAHERLHIGEMRAAADRES